LANLLLSLQLSEEKQRLTSSEEWHYSQLELPEDNHTDAGKHIKAILNIIMCHGCCLPDAPGMAIQYRMLMMANQSSGHDSSQTPSLRIRHVSERAKV